MKIVQKLAAGFLACVAFSGAAQSGELRLLTWEGYADKSFVDPYTAKTGCNVTAKYVGSGDEIITAMLTGRGSDYDLIAVSGDIVQRFVDADTVDPIDMTKIPNAAGFYDQFKAPAYAMTDGKQYAVPYVYGRIPIVVDKGQVSAEPDSLAFLWDPKLKGKIAVWDDISALFMAGRYLGVKDVYEMTDDELARVKDALIQLKPNIRKFWYSAGEVKELYQQNEIAASNIWEGPLTELVREGRNMYVVDAKEGTDGYIDNHLIVKGHGNNECVYSWLDYVSSPEVQAISHKVTGYTYSNAGMIGKLSDEDRAELAKIGAGDPKLLATLDWWRPVKERAKYIEVWNQVKSAAAQ